MTIHGKTAMILLSTLIIGILCGALITGAVTQARITPLGGAPSPDRFIRHMDRIIQPDAKQREAIQQTLEDYRPRFEATMTQHRDEIRALIDSLQKDLKPLLTEEQLERMRKRRMRGRQFFEGFKPDERRKPGPFRSPPPHPE